MIGWIALVPLLLSAVFGLAAAPIARRLPPGTGSWLLSCGAVLAAGASSASLGLLALLVFAQTPLATAQGRWSDAVLRRGGVPAPVGLVAAGAVLVLAWRGVRAAWRRGGAVLHAYRLAAGLPATGELAVVDLPTHQAFAVPGRPGRIVVSSGLLRSLDGRDRRALLAHERAHLRDGHHWHQSAVAAGSGGEPPARPRPGCAGAVLRAVGGRAGGGRIRADGRGRCAGPRRRAPGHGRGHRTAVTSSVVLAAAAGDLSARIGALHQPPPQLSRWRLAMPALLLVAIALAVAVALQDVEALFERAQAVYSAGR